MAKLLVPSGALCQASSGETFLPGQGQMAGLRGLQARFWSSPPKRTGIRAPSLIELEVRVIQGAAQAGRAVHRLAARPSATSLIPSIAAPFFWLAGAYLPRGGLGKGPRSGFVFRLAHPDGGDANPRSG